MHKLSEATRCMKRLTTRYGALPPTSLPAFNTIQYQSDRVTIQHTNYQDKYGNNGLFNH